MWFGSSDFCHCVFGFLTNYYEIDVRALPNLPSEMIQEDETPMHNKLYFFLAQQDQFSSELKKSLNNLHTSYEDVLVDLLNLCGDMLEKGGWVIPDTKWMYLKVRMTDGGKTLRRE